MDRRTALLLGLLGALVVGLFFLGVGLSSGDGRVDPNDAGGVEFLDSFLGGLPGVGRSIDPESIETDNDCFDGRVFRLDGAVPTCSFDIPADVQRVVLELRDPSCSIEVGSQPGVATQRLDAGDADDNGALRLGLTGDGATVRMSLTFADTCLIELK